MVDVQHWLAALPPAAIYLIVAGVIGVESMGVPLPGEIVLVSSALLAATTGAVDPLWLASFAAFGAIVGDSVGYAIGRRGGRPLLDRLGRRFPKHLGPAHLAQAERTFARYGVWAVFFGRFVALLRILAGPLAGMLHVPYRRFLVANAAGGLVWAFGTTYLIYTLGRVAEHWLKDFSWIALAVAVLVGLGGTWWLRSRTRNPEPSDETDPADSPAADSPAADSPAADAAAPMAADPPAADPPAADPVGADAQR
ncbi:DedA family protein [Micromonospora yangpuensis]|uniref:Membrane protein DedA, SNARE-associated domain n=1 Tax=Micromonospora yangpuensis TaxID=683228 RepID=A0A1C6UY58_9ACTN|nr:DedA family protein [Micromonospora yangpuensis]GGL95081.1 membrane protein [Micromonospora yangpuensis]SCL58952.1 membrane protein DedA, SNARE-associated domain [Micromonospora yangpuensis]